MLHVHRTVTRSSKDPDDTSAPSPLLDQILFHPSDSRQTATRSKECNSNLLYLSETFCAVAEEFGRRCQYGYQHTLPAPQLGHLIIAQSSSSVTNPILPSFSSVSYHNHTYVSHARHFFNSCFLLNIYPHIPQLPKLLASAKSSHHFALQCRIRIYHAAYTCIQPRLENATPALHDSGLA